jgi:HEAT repeat protein
VPSEPPEEDLADAGPVENPEDDERRARHAELIEQLRHGDWQIRQGAADALGELGADAADAVPDLQRALTDSDYDVRESVVRALGRITGADLLADYQRVLVEDPWEAVRRQAADTIASLGPEAEPAMPSLFERLPYESSPIVQDAIVRAMQAIDPALPVVERAIELMKTDARAIAGIALARNAGAERDDRRRLFEGAWDTLYRIEEPLVLDQAFEVARVYAQSIDDVIGRLLHDGELDAWKTSRLALYYVEQEAFDARLHTDRDAVLELYARALNDQYDFTRDAASGRLARFVEMTKTHELPPPSPAESDALRALLQRAVQEQGVGLAALTLLIGDADTLSVLSEGGVAATRALLLEGRDLLDRTWKQHTATLLAHIRTALENAFDYQVAKAAIDVLDENRLASIPFGDRGDVEDLLQRTAADDRIYPDVRNAAQVALIKLREIKRGAEIGELIEILRSGQSGAQLETIDSLLKLQTPEATRALITEWTRWIALSDQPLLVASTAEKLRYATHAILPLLEQFDRGFELDDDLNERLKLVVTPREHAAAIDTVLGGGKVSDTVSLAVVGWVGVDAVDGSLATAVDEHLKRLVEAERARRELLVRQRLARQLADMGDERFFGDDEQEQLKANRRELQNHAVLILGPRLTAEGEDATIRESIARTLGNVGSRDAVDALARAVVGEERTRRNRQDLLAKYYLEPSKVRSDEAAKILHDAVEEAKRTLRILQVLNVLFFGVAIAVLIGGALVFIFSSDAWTRVGGAVGGLTGFIGVVLQIIREPLQRIQNAVTRLVQVETAFASFIWELNLNGTYIQSQYVAEGVLEDKEIATTVDRIESAMQLAMDLVARYAEEGRAQPTPRITSVVPSAAAPGTVVAIYGTGLGARGRGSREGVVALNHALTGVRPFEYNDTVVRFTLPSVVAIDGDTAWLSLVVDGIETNALPFKLLREPTARQGRNSAGNARGVRSAAARVTRT